jgi:hypothetical protein
MLPTMLRSSEDSEIKTTTTSSPEVIVCITVSLLFLLSSTLGEHLALIHLCDLPRIISVFTEYRHQKLTCSGAVASSAPLSSRTRINRGNRNEIPRSSISESLDQHIGTSMTRLFIETYQALRSRVNRTQAKIRREHLPDHLGLEPHIRLCSAHLDVAAYLVDFEGLQHCIVSR